MLQEIDGLAIELVTASAAGSTVGPSTFSATDQADDFSFAPRKPIDAVRLDCLDVLQALRRMKLLPVDPQNRFKDHIGHVFCEVLADATTPLCVAVALCQSLVIVPGQLPDDIGANLEAVMRCLLDPEFGALMEDEYIFEPKFRVMLMDILTLASNPIAKIKEHRDFRPQVQVS